MMDLRSVAKIYENIVFLFVLLRYVILFHDALLSIQGIKVWS